jgi:dipeptidyl aminopeptidase/acylaminoacyl peptidase
MRTRLLVALQLAALIFPRASCGQNERTFTEPNSILLLGWAYGDILVATPSGNIAVENLRGSQRRGYFVIPGLSPRVDQVAWGLTLPIDSGGTRCDDLLIVCNLPGYAEYKSVMGVYSLRDKGWKTYGDFCPMGAGSAAFSPDGAKIAFEAEIRSTNSSCSSGDGRSALLILDLATGQFTQVPNTAMVMANARISWSPDGRFLAGQVGAWSSSSEVVLIEVGSWVQKVIADGWNPSWSPFGDWIAFQTEGGSKCMIIHPDGTGARMVFDVGRKSGWGDWALPWGVVWSPDEKTLILSEEEFSGRTNVVSMDLATGKVKKMPRHTPSIFAWVPQSIEKRALVAGSFDKTTQP